MAEGLCVPPQVAEGLCVPLVCWDVGVPDLKGSSLRRVLAPARLCLPFCGQPQVAAAGQR